MCVCVDSVYSSYVCVCVQSTVQPILFHADPQRPWERAARSGLFKALTCIFNDWLWWRGAGSRILMCVFKEENRKGVIMLHIDTVIRKSSLPWQRDQKVALSIHWWCGNLKRLKE